MAENRTPKLRILERQYADRQFIVVTDDDLAQATRSAEIQARDQATGANWERIAEISFQLILGGTGRLVAEVTREVIEAWSRARESGVPILAVGKSEVAEISFPPGHPRERVLYIGHPALPHVYYTTADFHRVTFEHKFSEAIDLLMSLGAKKITVEHVRGWSKDFSSHLSVPLGGTGPSVEARADSSRASGANLLFEATLDGAEEPKLPHNLVWYPHEATWQSIANGRMQFGLRSFSLSVSYDDDFGVNAGFKTSVVKSGLELGGKFEGHQSTVWRLSGEFASRD